MKKKLICFLTLFVVIPLMYSCGSKTYYFNFYGDNCTIDNQSEFHKKINLGEKDLTFQIAAEKDYILPKEIETESLNVTYDSGQGIIKISEVKGDITISATAKYGYSHFSFAGVNCTINDQKIYNEDILIGTKNIDYYVKPIDDYALPTKIDGIDDDPNITYNKEDGLIHISEVISDINITATSKYKYSFTFTGTNCTIQGSENYSSDLNEDDEEIVFTINPTDKYIYPLESDVTISGEGAKNATYDETNGTITISKVTGSIDVTAITTQEANVVLRFDPDNGEEPFNRWTEYKTPIDPPDNPTKKDKIWNYTFDGWHKVLLDGIQEEEFNFAQPENYTGSIINLIAKWKKNDYNKYIITAEPASGLRFKDKNTYQDLTNVEITAGRNYMFMMFLDVSNDIDYYAVPTVLDIFVGDSKIPLSNEQYYIVPNAEESEATVLIYGENITGDIIIRSDGAVQFDYFIYKVKANYGVEDIEGGMRLVNEPLQITFTPTENYTLPKAENIYVFFDGIGEQGAYVSPTEGFADCVYDETTGVLTISSTEALPWIKNNIEIYVRANNFQLLNALTWDEISSYGECGYAKYLFYIGEKMTINMYGYPHIIMIIDFDFDRISGSDRRAPYTFQFYNIITKYWGQSYNTPWNKTDFEEGNNFDYRSSDLNNFVNKTIYGDLPSELKGHIKTVSKKAELTDQARHINPVDYDTRLFPLSTSEMTRKNAEAYSLYKNASKNDFARPRVGAGNEDYWARTPYGNDGYSHYYGAKVQSAYNSFCGEMVWSEYGVTPAFCI